MGGVEALRQVRWDWGLALLIGTIILACIAHFIGLDTLPMGFYVDESSIGYNAHLISLDGTDEHGERWPLFFEAFGEYKNPIYIYLLAFLYRCFGYTEWVTRATSAICWLTGSALLYVLSRHLFVDRLTRLYVAIALCFTPWLFALSRVSFEVISLYPLLALHLLAIHRGFQGDSVRWAFVAGVSIGLCAYAYSTFRLLAPLHGAALIACYVAVRYRRALIAFIAGAVLSVVPFAIYVLGHLEHLTRRFGELTYLQDPALTTVQKAVLFTKVYAGYFNPLFLGVVGDPNLRHHSGFGGELLIGTVLLLVVLIVRFRSLRWNRFHFYLIAGLLLAPLGAALTSDHGHSLRSFSMATFAILLSAYAINLLRAMLAKAVVVVTAVAATAYVAHYFLRYPIVSAVAFENYGAKQALRQALARHPARVVAIGDPSQYVNVYFFGSLIGAKVPLVQASSRDLRPGDLFILRDPWRFRAPHRGLYVIGTPEELADYFSFRRPHRTDCAFRP